MVPLGHPAGDPTPSAIDIAPPCPSGDPRLEDMVLLGEVHHRLTAALEEELEQRCGLPLRSFEVLLQLMRAPHHQLTVTELAHRVDFTSGGATRLVDRLEQAALVERVHCPSDRRSVWVRLTSAGERAFAAAVAVHLETLDERLVKPLSSGERQALRVALHKLLA